ncbi:hypothetical protein BCR44DRAFT_1513141 [Catenaria anguillulae PL171]|uniref:Uncharacterized protein n=1 Tax=Catenaria anguillulae PL171 TaxID=765915 RepID=A0A1Y2HM32_9FUNG|nr:hypothetical protein BCR44DRAFT_1513141 [Catenaria anguillulae PL171]
MFCLQALLPLLLFPQAASSPFFLVAYLTAIILNHRPCVYCLVLFLGALYASCFWGSGTCWANVWPAYPDGSSLSWETHEAPATANVDDLPSNPIESLVSTLTCVDSVAKLKRKLRPIATDTSTAPVS